jgi:hypothetical protein
MLYIYVQGVPEKNTVPVFQLIVGGNRKFNLTYLSFKVRGYQTINLLLENFEYEYDYKYEM